MKKALPTRAVIEEALKFQRIPELLCRRKTVLRKHFDMNKWTHEIKARELCYLLMKRINFDLHALPLDEMIKLHRKIRVIRRKYPHFYGECEAL